MIEHRGHPFSFFPVVAMSGLSLNITVDPAPPPTKKAEKKRKKINKKRQQKKEQGRSFVKRKKSADESNKEASNPHSNKKETKKRPLPTTTVETNKVQPHNPPKLPHVPSEKPIVVRSKKPKLERDISPEQLEYLRKFHARPRELDRRHNARPLNVSASTSTHLFDNQSWDFLHKDIQRRLRFDQPTKIQSLTQGAFAQHRHLMIHAETGSGKTLAYTLPILQEMSVVDGAWVKVDRASGIQVLVLAPTRELASQIHAVIHKLTIPNVVVNLLSQDKHKSEKSRIRKGSTILVSTPGRLLDHIRNTESLRLNKLKYWVLDEADRLLDMGLGPQIAEIKSHLPQSSLRVFLVSATLQPKLLEQFPSLEFHTVSDTTSAAQSVPQQLKQNVLIVSAKYRLPALLRFLERSQKTIVFFSTCACVDYFFELLEDLPSRFKLHGNMSQSDRQRHIRAFSSSQEGILLATDVAARGLDLKSRWSVQYDVPCEVSDYVHRIGRVARAGDAGNSILFLLPSEQEFLPVLEERGMQPVRVSLSSILRANGGDDETLCHSITKKFHDRIADSTKLRSLGESAYQSYLRQYPTKEKKISHLFQVKSLHLGHVARSFCVDIPQKNMSNNPSLAPARLQLFQNAAALQQKSF